MKNVKGCIGLAREAGMPLRVLGGSRIQMKMGIRITMDLNVRIEGMVGGIPKNQLLNGSRALLFPVIGTPCGSLPELINALENLRQ